MTDERLKELAGLPSEINWSPTKLLYEAHEMARMLISLRAALEAAAMSLETIDEQAGFDADLKTTFQIRGYAYSRAGAARAALK